MKASYDNYLFENPPCTKFAGDPDAKAIFDLLSKDENIIAMIDASDAGRPALTPVVSVVENYFDAHPNTQFDLTKTFPRTVVGCMIKSILAPFGYVVEIQRDLPLAAKKKYFSSASCYRYDKEARATMKVTRAVVPIYVSY